ncbi:MAG: transglutaminase protein [Fibrobacteres bacterium]|nr:transglutaminase protein [Fibrobacterota bacterium]
MVGIDRPCAILIVLTALLASTFSYSRAAATGAAPERPARADGAMSRVISSKSPAATVDTAGPSTVLKSFDSLMEAGRYPQARRLCAGQMLRMFDFIVLTQSKIAGYLDSARSREETLEEKAAGDWAYAKIYGRMVFKRPFMGQDSLTSFQAAHLYRSPRGWLITEMEELEGADSPVHLRSGIPEGVDGTLEGAAGSAGSGPRMNLFPVSSRAPERPGVADRIQYRLRLKNGSALAGSCPLDGTQRLVRAVSPSEWIVENRKRSTQGRATPGKTGTAPGKGKALPADSARVYLASNPYLNLEDTLLTRRAGSIAPGESDPARIAGAIYDWVAGRFRFQMGSVLFGTSSETIRDLRGDCSEAAILTAALLRARGVPARVALGFASLGKGVFIGHAWCEAWLDDGWVGVDAALREFPAGVDRVKLAVLDGRGERAPDKRERAGGEGHGDMRIAATNLMMRTISNLDIEIVGAWQKGRSLPLKAYPDNSAEAGKFFQEILDGIGKK